MEPVEKSASSVKEGEIRPVIAAKVLDIMKVSDSVLIHSSKRFGISIAYSNNGNSVQFSTSELDQQAITHNIPPELLTKLKQYILQVSLGDIYEIAIFDYNGNRVK